MTAALLLDRLAKVRHLGVGRWVCACPAHEDSTPSLTVRERPDGLVLVHDFGGCSVEEVLAAVGLEMDVLFPERPVHHAPRENRPFIPTDVFEIARREIAVAAVIASDVKAGRFVSAEDFDRLAVAASRLDDIAGAAYGR